MSELLWVAVPDGRRPTNRASIRVLVVPRLAEGSIQEFGLGDWPATLADEVVFQLRTRTSLGERVAAGRPRYVARARSEVWSGFFGGDAGLTNAYEARTNPVPDVTSSYDDARTVVATYRAVTRDCADPRTDSGAAIRSALIPLAAHEPEPPPVSTDPPAFATPDFHATVSWLREHPTVLLDLGLVFELVVDVADLDLGTAEAGRQLSIRCTDPPFLRPLVSSPWTRYDLTGADFRPAPEPGSDAGIRHGLLDLSDSVSITDPTAPADPVRWAIATFDVGVAGNLRQAGRELAADPRKQPAMPVLRSTGLALLRPGRRQDFAARVGAAALRSTAAMTDTVLGAEDLVLGYRVDIRRESTPWLSVCERDAAYSIDDIGIGTAESPDGFVREEGHVKALAAVKDADGGLRADEVAFRWTGWNLAVPLPNLRGDTRGPVPDPRRPLPYRFMWRFAVPVGRLPKLRFADLYQLRVRVADLAGGGLRPDEVEDAVADGQAFASATVTYRRHDPIPPPRLRATGPYAPGAAIDRMVVRSDKDLTPEQLHALDPDYPLTETRTLDTPIAPLQLIEQHRVLDDPELSDEETFVLARRAMIAEADGSGLADPAAEGVNATVPKAPGGLADTLSDRSAWTALTPGRPVWPDRRPKTIKLAAHGAGSVPVTMRWTGDGRNDLQVTLGKGEQATVELSSTIVGDFEDHFALTDHLSNQQISPDKTKKGRNPVVCPPARIVVVHAVRRPLATPRWLPPPDTVVERAPGDTTLVLKPVFAAVAAGEGLNTDSTGRLDVAASWTEYEDVGAEAGPGERTVTVEHLHSQSIDRGDPPRMAIRHEFGDTKHRTVTYTLHATTRYREYFKATEPESLFQDSQQQQPVNVPSSVRPPAPVVLGVVPAFAWERTQPGPDRIEHTRRSRRLRVELARPWFVTGEGERLAVVLAPDDTGPAAASDLVSRIGRDPLFATAAVPPRPAPGWFPGTTATRVPLPELNGQVTVVPFDVVAAGDRWYADVELAPPTRSYHPFVRLAVARYQRDSLTGPAVPPLWLSPVVITERVPLLPDRHVVLTRTGGQVTITVDGVAPHPPNRLEAILETCDPGVDPAAVHLVLDNTVPGGPAVEPGVPAWRPVEGARVVRTPAGAIPPLPLAATPGPLRIRIRETEDLPGSADGGPPDLVRRNVFVDTIILPAAWRPA
ncbi:hypothetical protein ACTOB_004856 [Actinoplanes oblitus]|uniref:Baseplate protein J-like domain-containing protein n=1 Tax=Actinoplanes oblitus TaxID=3040509 RepID=A0ABY8W784_9ACTN|nr:hypothetical protein [Actinoplanes oblitus]WIM92898.1 hypothetical protein ACTOB_004856 [Actinoplanes oblitus]